VHWLLGELGPRDCLIVTKLDRLARSLKDLLNTLDQVAKAGAGFRVLDTRRWTPPRPGELWSAGGRQRSLMSI
jgi:hypothetical protein